MEVPDNLLIFDFDARINELQLMIEKIKKFIKICKVKDGITREALHAISNISPLDIKNILKKLSPIEISRNAQLLMTLMQTDNIGLVRNVVYKLLKKPGHCFGCPGYMLSNECCMANKNNHCDYCKSREAIHGHHNGECGCDESNFSLELKEELNQRREK